MKYKELNEIFKKNKESLLKEPIEISPSRLNLFINSKAKFILTYFFNFRYSNYKLLFGKIAELLLKQKMQPKYLEEEIQNLMKDKNVIDTEENLQKERNDIEKFINNVLNDAIKIFNDKILYFDNEEFVFEEDNLKIKIIPDLIYKNRKTNKIEIFEIKYTKRINTPDNISMSHVRQLLIYKAIMKQINQQSDYDAFLLYLSPTKYKLYKVENDLDIEYLRFAMRTYKSFIKNLNLNSAIFYILNELDSFYIGENEIEFMKQNFTIFRDNFVNLAIQEVNSY